MIGKTPGRMKSGGRGGSVLHCGDREKRSRSSIGAHKPASEIDQPPLTESGIVFIGSVSDVDINA